jgi:hypothetical protein
MPSNAASPAEGNRRSRKGHQIGHHVAGYPLGTRALISTLRRPLSCRTGAVKDRIVKKELGCAGEETTTGQYREPPDTHRTGTARGLCGAAVTSSYPNE